MKRNRGSSFTLSAGWPVLLAVCMGTAFADALMLLPDGHAMQEYWIVEQVQNPYYPRKAAKKGLEGCVVVAFVIEPNGTTSSHRLVHSAPDDSFAAPAVQAIAEWRFEPGVKNPDRRPALAFQIIEFNLDPSPSNAAIRDSASEACRRAKEEARAAVAP